MRIVENGVHARTDLRRAPREVDQDLSGHIVNGDSGSQRDNRSIGNIEARLACPRTRFAGANALPRRIFGTRNDLIRERLYVFQPVPIADLIERYAAALGAAYLGCKIAADVVGLADVTQDDVIQKLIELTSFVKLRRRNPEPLLMYVIRRGADSDAADIDVMVCRTDVADDRLATKDRSQDREIEEVPGAVPRIVGDKNVARIQIAGKEFGEVAAGIGQTVDVTRRSRFGLGDHPAALIEERVGEIAGIANDGAECRSLHGLRLLDDDAPKIRPQDFEFDAIHGNSPQF